MVVRIMITGYTIVVTVVIVAACQCVSAWIQPTGTGTRSGGTPIPTTYVSLKIRCSTNLNAEKPKATTTNNEENGVIGMSKDDDDKTPTVEWGVSYIGGDPCGSKYNTDPFDKNPSGKPGMPDDMKARIEALAQKKLLEERENKNR